MKIISLNVNNFGGINDKPLPKDYMLPNGKFNYEAWSKDVDDWRENNQANIKNNVDSIVALLHDFDIAFLHEVDTNCYSWDRLLEKMTCEYKWNPANGIDKNMYNEGKKSISCMFIKNGIEFEYGKNNFLNKQRNVEVKVGDTYIIGVHMSYDINDWEKLLLRYNKLQNEELLIIGDLNVFDKGTERREKFDKLLNVGAVDIWLAQGENDKIETANTQRRIDYALASQKLYKKGVHELILNSVRAKKNTDHAAVAVMYNEQ